MADEHDLAASLVVDGGLAMHLGDQRAGGVDGEELPPRRILRHGFRHAMGGEDHRRGAAGRHLVQFLDEDRALRLQPLDDVFVVYDLVPHIDRRAIDLERPLHRVDGAHDAGAEAARGAQENAQGRLFGC